MQNCDWLHFAERCGAEGRDWAEKYRQHWPTMELGNQTLKKLREDKLEEGERLLQEFIRQVESVRGEPDSVRAVLDRYRYGIEGYYYYCRKEFTPAQQSMRLAHDAVVRALSTSDWLLMLAVHCQEFCMHQGRIARNQHRWPEMQACIAEARAMMCDRSPLCETTDGRKIWWSNFKPFFDALAPLTDEETRIANTLLNPQERERLFDKFVRSMLRSPGNSSRYV
jgi:hypothetical protein